MHVMPAFSINETAGNPHRYVQWAGGEGRRTQTSSAGVEGEASVAVAKNKQIAIPIVEKT